MNIHLCKECAPDGCEVLTIGVMVEKKCDRCGGVWKQGENGAVYDLGTLLDFQWHDGYACGANTASEGLP